MYRRNDGEKDRETFADQGTVEIFREKTIEDMIDEQRAKLAAEGKVCYTAYEICLVIRRSHTSNCLLDPEHYINEFYGVTAMLYHAVPCRVCQPSLAITLSTPGSSVPDCCYKFQCMADAT